MSTIKSTLVYLSVVSVLSVGFLGLSAADSVAAIPEKASSQQEEIAASLGAAPSTALMLE